MCEVLLILFGVIIGVVLGICIGSVLYMASDDIDKSEDDFN